MLPDRLAVGSPPLRTRHVGLDRSAARQCTPSHRGGEHGGFRRHLSQSAWAAGTSAAGSLAAEFQGDQDQVVREAYCMIQRWFPGERDASALEVTHAGGAG